MRRLLLGLVLSAGTAGCGLLGGGGPPPADARFGHRHETPTDDDRETVLIAPPADSASVLVFPAFVDSVAVRPERSALGPGETTAVEVLLKGALPDACAELSGVTQSRLGANVTVSLTMHTPRRRVCAAVVRPFRFYLPLDGAFDAGSYTLTLNGTVHPFQIRQRATAE